MSGAVAAARTGSATGAKAVRVVTPGKCQRRGARNDHCAWRALVVSDRLRGARRDVRERGGLGRRRHRGVQGAAAAPGELAERPDADPLAVPVALRERVHQPHPSVPAVVALDVDGVVVAGRVLLLLLLGHLPEPVVPAAVPARELRVVAQDDRAGAVREPSQQAVEGDPLAAIGRELEVDAELLVGLLQVVEVRAAPIARQRPEPLVGRVDLAVRPLVDEHRPRRPQAVVGRVHVGLGDEGRPIAGQRARGLEGRGGRGRGTEEHREEQRVPRRGLGAVD